MLLVLLSTGYVCAEVNRKSNLNSDGTVEYVFHKEGNEIAKQIVDDRGNIIKTTGKIPDGTVKRYDENGKLVYECNYKDNKLEGIVKVYYASGELFKELNYKNGKLEGIKKGYHRNGEIENIRTYKNGNLVK